MVVAAAHPLGAERLPRGARVRQRRRRRPAGTRSRSSPRGHGPRSASHQPDAAAGLIGCQLPGTSHLGPPGGGRPDAERGHRGTAVRHRAGAGSPADHWLRDEQCHREVVWSERQERARAGMRGAGQHVPPAPVRAAAAPCPPSRRAAAARAGQPGGHGHRVAAVAGRAGRRHACPAAGPSACQRAVVRRRTSPGCSRRSRSAPRGHQQLLRVEAVRRGRLPRPGSASSAASSRWRRCEVDQPAGCPGRPARSRPSSQPW